MYVESPGGGGGNDCEEWPKGGSVVLVGTKEVGVAKFGSPGGNVVGGSLLGGGGANWP